MFSCFKKIRSGLRPLQLTKIENPPFDVNLGITEVRSIVWYDDLYYAIYFLSMLGRSENGAINNYVDAIQS